MRVKLPSPSQPRAERLRALQPRRFTPVSPIDIFENDEHAIFELGSPAYRNAHSRSGLGYVETQAELARFQGNVLQRLYKGRYHITSEPTALLAMMLLGLFCGILPSSLILAAVFLGGSAEFPVLLSLLVAGTPDILLGIFALGSVIASVASRLRKERRRTGNA